jgi:hypothetical protein
MRVSLYELESSPMVDLGELPAIHDTLLYDTALKVANDPGFSEPGRLSRRVAWGADSSNDSYLHVLGGIIAEHYFGELPAIGATATLSVVTDAKLYREHTQVEKIASYWHQDFIETEQGLFFAPPSLKRLIIPMMSGPYSAVGTLSLHDVEQLELTDEVPPVSKQEAVALNHTVVGVDGVLVKAEVISEGGEIVELTPNRGYIVPKDAAHKTNPILPDGRIFFQLDQIVSAPEFDPLALLAA